MSTIDREEAIRIIASYPGPVDKSVVRRLLTQMPTCNQPCDWISVTEKLPVVENSIGKRVLATTTWGLTVEAMYCKDHWEIHDTPYKLTSVAAWMPLPEPAKLENN